MATELRQRTNTSVRSGTGEMNGSRTSVTLCAPSMLRASPQHHGYVMKLHVPLIYSILPFFLQRLISKCFPFLGPKWKKRYLIQLGSFLYKFTSDSDPTKEPKGSPIPIESVDINILGSGENDYMQVALETMPEGFNSVFVVSSLRRSQYFASPNQEDTSTWVSSLRQARQEAITRSMGHAKTDSYPQSWTYYDSFGRNLLRRKERIRAKLEEKNLGEMEMSNLAEAGPLPRGYYG